MTLRKDPYIRAAREAPVLGLGSLQRRPSRDSLRLTARAADTDALRSLARDPTIRAQTGNEHGVRLLWDVCQIPDYRQLVLEDHVGLLGDVFLQLAGPRGRLSADWLERRIGGLDQTTGAIDDLLARLAFIRTWTFIAHRPAWVVDPDHWRARTRAIEDRVSDALHTQLVERGYLTLRFNFPFAEQRKKRADAPALLDRAFRAAANSLARDLQMAPARMFFGGMGLGARVATQIVAQGHSADGVICLGYPLHPSGKPNQQRAESLFRLICPVLFVQGSRDPYCRIDRLELLLRRIGAPTHLHVVEDVDHAFGLIKHTPRTPDEVQDEVVTAVDGFVQKALGSL